jgi:hypothetical protein
MCHIKDAVFGLQEYPGSYCHAFLSPAVLQHLALRSALHRGRWRQKVLATILSITFLMCHLRLFTVLMIIGFHPGKL